MPAVVPLAAAAAAAEGYTALALFLSLVSFAYQSEQANKARRRALDQYNASLQDRLEVIRSGVSPHQYVLGTIRLGGTQLYGDSVGPGNTVLDTVTALAANKCQIVGHYLADDYIADVDFPGDKYGTSSIDDYDEDFTVTPSGGAADIVVDFPPRSDADIRVFEKLGGRSYSERSFTRTGSTLHVTGLTSSTAHVRVQYKSESGVKIRSAFKDGAADQAAHSWGDVTTPLWDADHIGKGICFLRTLYFWDESLYDERGAPAHGAVLQGGWAANGTEYHQFYDPRDDSHPTYTDNPALLAAWWMTLPRNLGGCGIPSIWIDWDSVATAANICDEMVSVKKLDGTGYEYIKRYQCHTLLSTANSPLDNLEIILSSMAGEKVFSAGLYRVFAGAFRVATKTITDSDVEAIGNLQISTSSGVTPPNIVTATFADSTDHWRESSPQVVANEDYITADGHEEPLEIQLAATTDARQANYLQGIKLEEGRPVAGFWLPVGGIGEDIAIGDAVQIDLTGLGRYADYTFIVVNRVDHWNGKCDLQLAEIREQTHTLDPDTWTPADPVTVPDVSYLWSVTAPTGFTVTQTAPQRLPDYTVLARLVLAWDTPAQEYILQGGHHEIRYRRVGTDWVTVPPVPGDVTTTTITAALEDGDWYQFQLRAVNGVGAASEWTDFWDQIASFDAGSNNGWVIDVEGKPAGVRSVKGIVDRSQLDFNGIALRIASTPVTSVGYGLPAIPIDASEKYTLTIRHRSSAASPDGLYLQFYQKPTALPLGFTHIGESSGADPVCAPYWNTVYETFNRAMPGTAWVTEQFSYTPSFGTKFATFAMTNSNPSTAGVAYEVEWVRLTKVGGGANLLNQAGPSGADGRIIVGRGQCVVSVDSIKKEGGTSAWDSDAYSLLGFPTAHLRFKPSDTSASIMVGLNNDPLTDQDFAGITCAVYISGGIFALYENGSATGVTGTYTTQTVFLLTYDGSNVCYFADGVLLRTVAVTGTLYFDSSFLTPGGAINSVQFGPGVVVGQVDTAQIGPDAVTDFATYTDAGPNTRSSQPGVTDTGFPSFSFTPIADGVAHVVVNFTYESSPDGAGFPPTTYVGVYDPGGGGAGGVDCGNPVGNGFCSTTFKADLLAGVTYTIALKAKTHFLSFTGSWITATNTYFVVHFQKK